MLAVTSDHLPHPAYVGVNVILRADGSLVPSSAWASCAGPTASARRATTPLTRTPAATPS